MNRCDRCRRQLEYDERTKNVEVRLYGYGDGVQDERKLEGHVCLTCYQDIERTVTGVLGVPSVYPSHVVAMTGTAGTGVTILNSPKGTQP